MIQATIATLVLLFLPLNAKENLGCDLTISQAPEFHRLRLGQSLEEVYKVIPGLKTDDAFQARLRDAQVSRLPKQVMFSTSLSGDGYADPELASRLSSITIGVYADKVIQLGFSYSWPIWDSAGEFLVRLREATALPDEGSWVGTERGAYCKCKEFQVNVGISDSGGGYLNFGDLTATSRMEADKKVILERAKKDFRP